MTKPKKIFRILILTIGVLLLLLLAAQLIVPKLINLESIKGEILASVSKKVGGEVKCQKIGLSFFPYPHAVINEVSLSIPGKVSGSINALGVYSKLLPLLKGKLQIVEVDLESPEFKVVLPKKVAKKPEKELPAPSSDIPTLVTQILAPLILEVPNLKIEIENGKLDLSREGESLSSFKSIDAHIVLPPEGFKLRLSCASNLWEKMGVMSTLNATNYKGDVHVELNNFRPHRLTSHLLVNSPLKLADSSVSMSVDLNVNGLNNVQANVQGSIPLLSFRQGNKNSVIKGKSLKSTFRLDENEFKFSLGELNLDYPKVSLSGSFLSGRRTPRVKMELEARDMDVPTVREVALVLGGDISDVQEIFGIVKGGKVPVITVKSEGSTYDHLGDIKNILIRGNIVEGKILVPDVELELADVKGDAVILGGVLHGENLEARLGNSWGRQGSLKLGLGKDDHTFHMDIGVQADLRELPPIMKRLLDDKSFQEEINRIEDIKGNAAGRLVLGETTEEIKVRVDASELALSAKYQRIPFPIRISGGQFSFDETGIAAKSLNGKLGKSSFSQLAAGLGFKENPMLEVTSGKIDAFLDELHPWITSIEGSPVSPKDLRVLKGTVSLTSVRFKGPLLKPDLFDMETTAEIKDVLVDSAALPGPVRVIKGSFHAIANPTAQKGTVKHAQISFLDASLNVSGGIDDYFKGLNKAEATFEGDTGPEFIRWVSLLIHLPPALNLRTPLSVSEGRLVWQKDTKTSFTGNLLVRDGPKVSVDLLQKPPELSLKNTIRDEVSDASTVLILSEKKVSLEFKGNLKNQTLHNLFVESGLFQGWLEGDFRAYISLNDIRNSEAEGHLTGENLIFPWALRIPLEINQISLKAAERNVDVERATLVSGSQKIELEGSLDFSPPGLVFNMAVKSNGINWTDINGLLGKGDKENRLEQRKASWDLPVKGTVRLESEYFNYERFTWFPFHADITFAQNEIAVKVIQANLCHIATPGSLKITPQEVSLDFDFDSKNQELNPTILCSSGQQSDITGNFDLLGKVKAQGKADQLLESLNGNLELTARDGRIRRHVPLQRVFAYLNLTKSLSGQLPDMTKEEFVYNSIIAKTTIQDGKVILSEGIIDSPSMEIISQGYVDYMKNKLDLMVLVAPFKTIDWVVKKVPLVRRILRGTLIAVPVKVTGDLADPKVSPMSASAIGSSLLDIVKRTVQLPVTVIHEAGGPGAEVIPVEPEE